MNRATIAFFNNKGGVGKTSLVYHLAWMYSDLGYRVLAADFDPQANLTAAFLEVDRLETLWNDKDRPSTVFGSLQPLLKGTGDISNPSLEPIEDRLALLAGNLALSGFEDELSNQWPQCLDGKERAFRIISAFWRVIQKGTSKHDAQIVLMDLGPNLGAINRAALIAADYIIVPMSPDLFSLQGLQNLGPTLRRWRSEWKNRFEKNPVPDLELPHGNMQTAGYIVLQHSVRLDRPVKAYERWMARIPEVYHSFVLDEQVQDQISIREDSQCLALLKHFRSLMPLAQEANKPIFHLKSADGAIGAHYKSVQEAYETFEVLAEKIAKATQLILT